MTDRTHARHPRSTEATPKLAHRDDPRTTDPAWGPGPLGRVVTGRLRLIVVVNIAAALWYFTWLLQPTRMGDTTLYLLLVLTETFNLVQATGFWLSIVRQRRPAIRPPAAAVGPTSVDVFVPRYDEPVDIVAPVLAAARRLRGAEVTVYLLDDGGDDQMRQLADQLGVRYVRRAAHTGAKAGNINNALRITSAPFVAVFDCDHVPHPDFLVETLGHFADEKVAFVQTPQHYANADTNEVASAAWAQQALFFGCIARGKDALGAMFCCGTNVILRRAALEPEGFPEDSITEDFLLAMRLHEAGWKSAYVPKVLAQGLGPEDMASYLSQQLRWARGCLSVIPAVVRAKLSLGVKAQYLLSSMYFLTGWTVLVYMTLPVVRILTGRQPLAATNADQFLLHFVPYFAVSLATVAVGGGGRYTFRAFALAASTFWVHIAATLATLARRKGRFVVTPKSGANARQPAAVWPTLLCIIGLVGVAGFGLSGSQSPAMLNNVAFAAVHVCILSAGVAAALHRPARATVHAEDVPEEIPELAESP
jgi:cellulose synthase (UDP-forming)